jgi:hypothetical protein
MNFNPANFSSSFLKNFFLFPTYLQKRVQIESFFSYPPNFFQSFFKLFALISFLFFKAGANEITF